MITARRRATGGGQRAAGDGRQAAARRPRRVNRRRKRRSSSRATSAKNGVIDKTPACVCAGQQRGVRRANASDTHGLRASALVISRANGPGLVEHPTMSWSQDGGVRQRYEGPEFENKIKLRASALVISRANTYCTHHGSSRSRLRASRRK